MEKWKIATILALLVAMIGYGAYQNAPKEAATTPTSGAAAGATPGAAPPSPMDEIYRGKTLPTWNFPQWMNTSKPLSNADLLGKTTLVEIFRINCSHCQEAAPFMAAINGRYKSRGLQMMGIQSPANFKDPLNEENKWLEVQNWAKERHLQYPIAFDEKSSYFQGTITKDFLAGDTSKLFYPMMILVGPDGKIIFAQSGHDTSKAIELGVELEKRFPATQNATKSAADLEKWLHLNLPDLELDPTLSKALTDDLAQRLKGKIAVK